MKLNQTQDNFFANKGWSANKFLSHASYFAANFKGDIKIGRTVVYVEYHNKQVKIYVHHNGKTNDHLTITDFKGNELITLHCSEPKEKLLNEINTLLGI